MTTRKLQQEFDRTNKKISEGLTMFDDIYDKHMSSEVGSQKDKLESDLKKEIKKLQRSRDQLKNWIGDASIKLDKTLLKSNRTKIEHAMDQFKDLEKSSKIKQFSNEGLELQSQRSKYGKYTDGDNSKKNEACLYISDTIDNLNQQNEGLESELHQLTVQLKKSKSSTAAAVQSSIDDCKHKVQRNALHLTKLEIILRNLENENLDPDRVDDIKDDLDYYVENNQEDDYVEYDDFYDQLDMDESSLEVQGSLSHPLSQERSNDLSSDKIEEDINKEEVEGTEGNTEAKDEVKSISKSEGKKDEIKSDVKFENKAVEMTGKKLKPAVPPSNVPTVNGVASYSNVIKAAQVATSLSPVSSGGILSPDIPKKKTAADILSERLDRESESRVISSDREVEFRDSISKIAVIAQSRLQSPLPYRSISNLTEASLINCPDSFDSEKPRQYTPVHVHPSSIDYPQEPMYELNSVNLMKKFENDTLFFCFYYSSESNVISKWNAAKELSRRGWVFNTESKQWFLKDSKNGTKVRTASVTQDMKDHQVTESEEDNFKYFDYEKTWLTRRKENFIFDSAIRESY